MLEVKKLDLVYNQSVMAIQGISIKVPKTAPPGIPNVRIVALFGRSRAEIEAPDREADSPGIALIVRFPAEQQVGDALTFFQRPVLPHKLTTPGIRGPEAIDRLERCSGINLDRQFVRRLNATAEGQQKKKA